MRLWSIHPKYLDVRGLVALWREALLAQKVLAGGTRGYTRHPQLIRFRECPRPLAAMTIYLKGIWEEADRRGYQFDQRKIKRTRTLVEPIPVTRGQVQFEQEHLRAKLKGRDPGQYAVFLVVKRPALHPLFRVVPGGKESWER